MKKVQKKMAFLYEKRLEKMFLIIGDYFINNEYELLHLYSI